jgi:F-type H+-transporting ATPase subunit epsilon
MADPFQFDLVAPTRLMMSESVQQVVVPGADGYFTVLKGHAPLMSSLKPGIIDVTRAGGEVLRIFVRSGFADVSTTGLTILAEDAVALAEVDKAKLAQDVTDAEEDVADAKDPATKAAAETRLQQLKEIQGVLTRAA